MLAVENFTEAADRFLNRHVLAIETVELFGNKEYEKFVGVFSSASSAGFAIGSPFGNICFDIFGNYNLAFLIFGVVLVFVAVSMQYVLNAAKRDRIIIENTPEN